MGPDAQPTHSNGGSPSGESYPKINVNQYSWVKARIQTAMRAQLALDEVARTGADRSALSQAHDAVRDGVADEIIRHLNLRPPEE